MTATRTLRHITVAAFDAAFPPVPDPITSPITVRARLELDGETYSLTRVVMPDGELRRFARQFNGYCESVDSTPEDRRRSMSYDCAWTAVDVLEVVHAEPPLPAIGSEVQMIDGPNAGDIGRVVAVDGHELGVDMRPDEVLVTWKGAGSQVISVRRLRVTWSAEQPVAYARECADAEQVPGTRAERADDAEQDAPNPPPAFLDPLPTHQHEWHPFVAENILRCSCGATARRGAVHETDGLEQAARDVRAALAGRRRQMEAAPATELQIREQADAIATLAAAIAGGRINGPRWAAVARLADQVATLRAWTPDDRS